MNTKHDYIAVFDSGVGGLSVLRHLRRVMPGERYLYFGDSANAPYGTKTKEDVKKLTFDAAQRLISRGIKALVVACNTATSAAIHDLRIAYPDLVVIGIEPALKLAAERFPGGKLCVMATPMTLREEKFAALMRRYEEVCHVQKLPAPGLVELVEGGKADSPETDSLLKTLFATLESTPDAVVLGCTHYPFAAKAISRVLGGGVTLLDGGEGTARETRRRLAEAGLLEEGEGALVIENSREDPALIDLSWNLLK
ncbi:MAG: glutamate racemase [Oscillospiraceae bacterium]|nr:glutamate racemase [Oscillospiraceae bacterium]